MPIVPGSVGPGYGIPNTSPQTPTSSDSPVTFWPSALDYVKNNKFDPLHPSDYLHGLFSSISQASYDYKHSSKYYIDQIQKLAESGDTAAMQYLLNYYATKESEKTAREWTAEREDNAYQRLNEDLKKAGISPYVLSGATPSVSSSSGHSYSGSQLVTDANNKRSVEASERNANLQSILRLIGVIGAALMYALI